MAATDVTHEVDRDESEETNDTTEEEERNSLRVNMLDGRIRDVERISVETNKRVSKVSDEIKTLLGLWDS